MVINNKEDNQTLDKDNKCLGNNDGGGVSGSIIGKRSCKEEGDNRVSSRFFGGGPQLCNDVVMTRMEVILSSITVIWTCV
jgi:hypothetical protein